MKAIQIMQEVAILSRFKQFQAQPMILKNSVLNI